MPDQKLTNNLTPKDDFLAAKLGEQFMEIVQNPTFRRAAEAALLEYVLRLPEDARNAYRMEGARGAINTLLNLGNPLVGVPVPDVMQLSPT